ncbi:DUF3226 domain-containing protein [Spirosoma aerolatum]|uniref:DUF3226 domain-containing protein n=1 Tax=Spirosoma aerolatum TaxID=1211326 RepID=UPI0009AC8B92|nr:DUF3226 domain-containing protein [Spirosoma aerolatum]
MKVREKFNAKLLVEGNDDQHVVWAICEKYNIPETFDVIDCEGISRILERLPLELKQESIKAIGVVLDADQDLQKRWKNLSGILSSFGYAIPDQPSPEGFTHLPHDIYPTIGIWLMPDNLQSGMLEDFIRLLIRPNDLLSPFVEQALVQLEAQPIDSRYSEIHRAKAYIHTWLAWQKDPGTPMGLAVTKTYLDHNTELCQRFVNWLNRLFNPEPQTVL